MSEHVEVAKECLGNASMMSSYNASQSALAVAQGHATLALVEQQRIANLIELSGPGGDHVAFKGIYTGGKFRPEIAQALGIEVTE